MMKNVFSIVIIFAFLFTSCSESGDRPLSSRMRARIDSLANVYNQKHIPEYDSICQLKMDSMTTKYFDSILEKKMYEFEKLNQ